MWWFRAAPREAIVRAPQPVAVYGGGWKQGGHASRGFARAELLILLGLLVIVISIVVPAAWAVRNRLRHRQVEADFDRVAYAVDRYFMEYRTWPSLYTGAYVDTRYGQEIPNREVVNALRARSGPGNPAHRLNPHRIDFLEVGAYAEGRSGLDERGEYLDPWGAPYQLVMDTNLDQHCYVVDSVYGKQMDIDFLMWSYGPDRQSDTADDILSWERR